MLLLCVVTTVLTATAQDKNLFQKENFTAPGGFVLPYRIMYPENYNPAAKYPLVLFLHGAGERGGDNEKQLVHGTDFFIRHNYDKSQFPAIVVAPQCPEAGFWANITRREKESFLGAGYTFETESKPAPAMQAVMDLVRNLLASGKIDKQRVYVGGLSMGGMGTLELIWRMPGTFAAAFPVCGGGDVQRLTKIAGSGIGIWLFHGDVDAVVPVQYSRNIYNTLKEKGCDVRYTEYPDVNHNSWDHTFQECALMPWLFGHRKK